MILCEKCREEIPNPDPETFDFDLKAIVYDDGGRYFPSSSTWRILSIMLARGPKKLVKREELFVIWDGGGDVPENMGHGIRERLRILRKALNSTPWKIKNRGWDSVYLEKINNV